MASRPHGRRRFDDDIDESPRSSTFIPIPITDDEHDEPNWSTYPDSAHGPEPTPPWVIQSPAAIDTDLGVMKSGKEADVSLLRREHHHASALMAVKRYRDPHHRLFHRDASYLEGRRMRRSRENRAMDTRTAFGRELIAGQWAVAEFRVLCDLWSIGAAVPYPVQLDGTELMMEFIGDPDGTAAPRLAQVRPSPRDARSLFDQLRSVLFELAEAGYAHGDLSPYNILVHEERLVLIDLPQAVDLVGNPQGFQYLERDCRNVCAWFESRGVDADPEELAHRVRAAVR